MMRLTAAGVPIGSSIVWCLRIALTAPCNVALICSSKTIMLSVLSRAMIFLLMKAGFVRRGSWVFHGRRRNLRTRQPVGNPRRAVQGGDRSLADWAFTLDAYHVHVLHRCDGSRGQARIGNRNQRYVVAHDSSDAINFRPGNAAGRLRWSLPSAVAV